MPPNEEAADTILAKRDMDRKLIDALERSVQQRVEFEVAITKEMGELNATMRLINQRLEESAKWMDNTQKIIWGDPTKMGSDGLVAVSHRNTASISSCGETHKREMGDFRKEIDSELSRVKTIWSSIMFFGGALWTFLIDRFTHRGP